MDLNFFYNVLKDICKWLKNRTTYNVEVKYVELAWLENSPLKKQWEEEGYELRWTQNKKVATKEEDGWEVIYQIDEKSKTKYKFIVQNNVDLILMRRKKHCSKK